MKDFFENNCDVAEDLLPLYADGGCSENTAKLLRKHLDVCPECRKYLKSVKRMKSKVLEDDIPDSAPDYKTLSKKIKRRRKIYTSIITSALILLTAGDIIYFITNDR